MVRTRSVALRRSRARSRRRMVLKEAVGDFPRHEYHSVLVRGSRASQLSGWKVLTVRRDFFAPLQHAADIQDRKWLDVPQRPMLSLARGLRSVISFVSTFRMPCEILRRLYSATATVWMGTQLLGCARGDIVLGTGATRSMEVAASAEPSLPDASLAAESTVPVAPHVHGAQQPPMAASGVTGTAQVSTMPVGTSPANEDVDAGAPRPVGRPSSGCGQEPVEREVLVDGVPASFLLDIPEGYDKARAYPLILSFRDLDESAAEFRTRLSLVDDAQAFVVYANPMVDALGWQFRSDIAQVDALTSSLGRAYCVDLDRLFAIGDGAGALFANLVGCARGEQMRAIAMLSSAPPPPGPCYGNSAVWLLQRTDTDPMTVGNGLGNRDFWSSRNACDASKPQQAVGASSCVEYAGCMPGMLVRFCEYRGSNWPSFAVRGAWEFFDAL